MSVRGVLFPGLVLALAFAGCGGDGETSGGDRPPNVLLITIETLRADHVSSYGYERRTTPNLDLLASQGARFETAIAQAPFTLPSIASVMSGRTPTRHGVRNHPASLPEEVETLAARFSAAGYRTVAHFSNGYLRSELGLTRGFDVATHHGSDEDTVAAAVGALSTPGDDRPLFLFVNLMSAHSPYVVANEVPWSAAAAGALDAPWAAPYRIDSGGFKGLITSSRPAVGGPTLEVGYTNGEAPIPPDGLQALQTIYDGELTRLDRALRELIIGWNGAGLGAVEVLK